MRSMDRVVVMLAVVLAGCATQPQAVPPSEVAGWRRDVAFVVQSIAAGHAEPFHATSESDWRRVAAELDAAIPRLPRHVIIVRLAALVARVGDGHTRLPWPLDPPALGFHTLPLQLEFFSDGLYVVGASPQYRELLGGRVVAIGGTDIGAAVTAVGTIVSHDNQYAIARIARRLLVIPEVLDALGIAPLRDTVAITVEKNGRRATLRLPGTVQPAPLLTFHESMNTTPPLHRRHPERFYWTTTLDDGRTRYVQINAVSNQPGQPPLPAFLDALLRELDAGTQRVVVDLRHNGGGSRELLLPFVEALAARPDLNRADRLFVVIGRETFSAALWAALDFANKTHATLVGEPTAGKPNFFGETRNAETPEHHIPFTWASRMNWRTDRSDTRDALPPQRLVTESFADYAAGRDPVLEALGDAR